MRTIRLSLCLSLAACGGKPPAADSAHTTAPSGGSESAEEFELREVESAEARGEFASQIEPTQTEAALRLFVVDKAGGGAIEGVVVKLAGPDGKAFYTGETDGKGYAEVLVPVGKSYDLTYLSLGRRDFRSKVKVEDAPNLNIKLTLRYKRHVSPTPPKPEPSAKPEPSEPEPRFVLEGVHFDTGKATLKPDSLAKLDGVVEYMTHKRSARIEISGHTDNVGDSESNRRLSEKRAGACKEYLVSQGIEGRRIEAVGYGDKRPIASNESETGRRKNRRIEATEL